MKIYVRYMWLLLFLFHLNSGFAQVLISVKTTKDTVVVGDPVELMISIRIPANQALKSIDFSNFKTIENLAYQNDTILLDKYADLEILDPGSWTALSNEKELDIQKMGFRTEGDMKVAENTIKFAIYNIGIFRIHAPMPKADQILDIFPAELPILYVMPPAGFENPDSIQLQPLKDILKESATWEDYKTYFYVSGIFIVLALLLYLWYKRYNARSEKADSEPEPIKVLAHDKALRSLKELQEDQLWQKGKIKEFQTRLTHIIRQYLEDRYFINALEMTTDEIANALIQTDFESKYTQGLKEILMVADLVKFAKAVPEENIHEQFLIRAIELVNNTQSPEV